MLDAKMLQILSKDQFLYYDIFNYKDMCEVVLTNFIFYFDKPNIFISIFQYYIYVCFQLDF